MTPLTAAGEGFVAVWPGCRAGAGVDGLLSFSCFKQTAELALALLIDFCIGAAFTTASVFFFDRPFWSRFKASDVASSRKATGSAIGPRSGLCTDVAWLKSSSRVAKPFEW